MKVCIFHDYIGELGGAEKVVFTLARYFKGLVITTELNRNSVEKAGYTDIKIESLGTPPGLPPFKQFTASILFSGASIDHDFDVYISSGNWAHYSALKYHPNIYYCHTPTRAFFEGKKRMIENQKSLFRKMAAYLWATVHKSFEVYNIRKNIDYIISNSKNVQNRVKSAYNLDSTIIYPPIPTEKYRFETLGDYWLSVNRLYPEKRIEMQLEIFRRLPEEKLKIVGGYSKTGLVAEYAMKCIKDAPENVEFIGEVTENELIKLYANCRGLITTAIDEDFGMTPVEAMASGKVAVVVDEGGYRESVIHNETGWLLPANITTFVTLIKKLTDNVLLDKKMKCIERARKFDTKIFCRKVETVIKNFIEMYRDRA